jgi:polysaccharide export outer membrane protein
MRFRILYSVLLLLAVLAAGMAWAQDNGHKPEAYRIGPEDVLEIVVWKNAEISRRVPVRPDGMISLPLVNDIMAAGLTPMELRDLLIKQLEEYVPNAEVSVIVAEIHSPKISVLGATTMGRHVLRNRITILDFLAQIGGLGKFASHTKIFVLRSQGDTVKRIRFNYKKALAAMEKGSEDGENFFLEPGDIVLVPQSLF